ncbi:MAG TPA: hypothetical protein VFE23_07355 [Usitatibacter sp.]|jgi:hypothetical protein|nr:hypothetical protein [Usitatibacter sp.]
MHDSGRWFPRIHRAQTEEELVEIVRQYAATWLPSDLDRLPPDCRIGRVTTGAEISVAAVTLTHADLRTSPAHQSADLLRAMTEVFVAAQMRLRQILGRRHDPSVSDSS